VSRQSANRAASYDYGSDFTTLLPTKFSMNRTIFLIAVAMLPFFLVGCNNHVFLSGCVTYSDDGTPLEAGTVVFETETFHARGEIGKNGEYTLATVRPEDGLPPGKYKVFVNGAFRVDVKPDRTFTEVQLIASKYASTETSGLEVNVDRSTKRFDFKVDRAPGSKKAD
jgi:hypothetical protein